MNKIKLKKIAIVLISAIIVVAIILGGYYFSTRRIKHFGIDIVPSKDYSVHTMEHYLQTDPEWSEENMGATNKTIGQVGCLISSVATVMNDMGVEVNPSEINKNLTDVDGYTGANLLWFKINEAYPEVDYRYSRISDAKTIEKDLENGQYPIVKVYYGGLGIEHWVIIAGASDGEFLIYDPMIAGSEPIPLSKHGKVYAYRVIEKG